MKLPLLLTVQPPLRKFNALNNYAPWIDHEFINQPKIKDTLHTKAKLTNSDTDWRIFRFQRNHVNNLNKTKKLNYFKHQLNITDKNNTDLDKNDYVTDKTMWKNIKNLTDNNKQTPPRVLAEGGKLITSIKQICNIANKHYINKITNIRNKFTNNIMVNPI